MALGNTVQYTPFQETSFGYGSGQLATNYATEFPNATDIVKIVIEHDSGNWDDTGHISTPVNGTALSVYNKKTQTWTVKGQRSDVDEVLSELKFFPADKPESRPYADDNPVGFEVIPFKLNETDGEFENEQPPAIGDTEFTVRIYDGNDVQQGSSETLTFDPVEPSYDNQRPYWSVEPTVKDYASASFDSEDGDLLDFGTISHGSDNTDITVECYTRLYSLSSRDLISSDGVLNIINFSGSQFGEFVGLDDFYISDKKPEEIDSNDRLKFSFTGSVDECQAFLDNVRFKTYGTNWDHSFEFVLTIFDGDIGSVVTKSMYHQKNILLNTLPNQKFIEDTTSKFDLGRITFSNLNKMREVNSYKAILTLDSVGAAGCTNFTTTYPLSNKPFQNGVLTLQTSSLGGLNAALRNLEFVPVTDFNDDFTFTVDFEFSNSDFGSTYTSITQTINVDGIEQSEVANITKTHNWTEDQVYLFKRNNPLQIIHPVNENFRVDFKFPTLTDYGDIGTFSTETFTRTVLQDVITFTGTRDALNDVLEELYYAPTTDFDKSFSLAVTVTRTSGDLTFETPSTGVFTMNATAQEEYHRGRITIKSWEEDTDKVDFSTGITILDTSTEDPLLPAYDAKYKMSLRAKYYDEDELTTYDAGSEMSWSCFNSSGCTVSGSGTTSDPLIITGNREDMNVAIKSLRMIPAADFTADDPFFFEFKLERGEPEDEFYALYTDWGQSGIPSYQDSLLYNQAGFGNFALTAILAALQAAVAALGYGNFVQTIVPSVNAAYFERGTPSPELESPDEVKFGLERLTSLDAIKIVDAAKNKQYDLNLTIDYAGEGRLRATARGSATVNWNADNKTLEISGNKTDINYTLLSLEYVPAFNFNTDFKIYIFQQQTTDDINQVDGSRYIDLKFDPTLLKYQLDLDNTRYVYEEDLLFQKNAFTYSKLKNLDGAEEITDEPIHYVTTLRTNPTTQLYFSYDYAESGALESDVLETRASEITFTGSRDYCNEKIRNLVISAYADQIGDVDVIYTQERWRNGSYDEIQADEITALTIRSSGDQPEASYTEWKQYFTTEGAETVNGQEATPRYLEEYATDENGNVINPYTRPVTIYDKASEPEGDTLYTVEVVSSNLLPGMYIEEIPYKTKNQFHNYIKNGIRLIAPESLYEQLKYRQEFKVVLRVKRKLPSGTEEVFENFSLTYQYIPRPRAYDFRTGSFIDNIRLSNEIYKEVRDFDATVQYDTGKQSDDTYWSFVYPAELEQFSTTRKIFDKHHDVVDAFEPIIGDFRTQVTTNLTNLSNSNIELETKTIRASSSKLKIWMFWDDFVETPFEDVDFTYDGFAPIEYNVFQVKPVGVNVSDNFTHEVSNHWGLKGKLDISYREQVIVHTDTFILSNEKYGQHLYPSGTKRKHTLGHDSAGLNGCWSVSGAALDDIYGGDLWRDKGYFMELSGLTLVNNIWVSPEGYGYTWGDTEDVWQRKNSGFPFQYMKHDGSRTNILRWPEVPTSRWVDGNGMHEDFRMRTPDNVFNVEDSTSSWPARDSTQFGVATYIGNLYKNEREWVGSGTAYLTNAEFARDYRNAGEVVDPGVTFVTRAATQFVGGSTNKHLTHFEFGDGLRFSSSSAKDVSDAINYNKYPFQCSITGVTFNNDGTTSAEWSWLLANLSLTEEVYVGGDDDDSVWQERPRQNWFKKVPYTPMNSENFDEAKFTHGMRYDVQVNHASTVKQKCYLKENGEYVSRDVYIPSEILCVRSYYYNYKTYNEAVVLVAKVPSDPEANLGIDRPVYEAKVYASDVKDGNSEMNMWARRNEFDNTSRILNVQYGNPTRSNFILPTGEYIDAYGLHSFSDKPLYNLKTDLRGKKIDNFIEVYKDTFAYVSVDEGVIDDGTKNIDISFDNMLTADKKFNYAYVAKDPFDKTKLYIQLKDTDFENTHYVFNTRSNHSKLVYINLEV
jgi:hypothetical protein